jgi:signal transduction histidine kinase|tara:strand:+ start:1355 stop:2188 length:834 start_codon:yes stop_codon:yes gene_type:complete
LLLAIYLVEGWFLLAILSVSFLLRMFLLALVRRIRRKGPLKSGTDVNEALYLTVSRLSHQLKNTGEVIRGHLHGFTDQLPQDEERWRVARRVIGDEALEVGNLTQHLDLMVRLGMSGQPLVMEPVNIPLLLEDLMINLAPAAEAKGIVLGGVVRGEDKEVPRISGDEAALREVFANLLENAVKHNGKGVEITGEVRHATNQIIVTISDTGKGIPQELVSTMFGRGNRRYAPGQNRGTGMGLYLCQLLTELHGGTISVSSEEGSGTTFETTLPLRRFG